MPFPKGALHVAFRLLGAEQINLLIFTAKPTP